MSYEPKEGRWIFRLLERGFGILSFSLSLYIGRIWSNKCSETNMPDFSLSDTGQKALQVIGVKTQRILPNPAMYDYCRDTF